MVSKKTYPPPPLAPVRYYFVKHASPPPTASGLLNPLNAFSSKEASISKGSVNYNPLFNFDQTFIDGLQNITSVELGQSVPYVHLKLMNKDRSVKCDLNMNYFHNPIDLSQMNSTSVRYPERPIMSLKEISLKTAPESGYLGFTYVTLQLKIHRPDFLASSALICLIFPGMPLTLEYGWNSPNELLNQKETMLFAVKSYQLSADETGQIDLTVEGLALTERLNNSYIGDFGTNIADIAGITNKESNSIFATYENIQSYMDYIDEILQAKDSPKSNLKILQNLSESYKSRYKQISKKIKDEYDSYITKISSKDVLFKTKKGKALLNYVKFHDVIHIFLNKTFAAIGGTYGLEKVKIVYGNFNKFAGSMSGKSIAEFPIKIDKFRSMLADMREDGIASPTVERFLNELGSNFIENENYYKSDLPTNMKEPEKFQQPDLYIHITNDGSVLSINFIDVKSGLPCSTEALMKLEKAPDNEAQRTVLAASEYDLAVIKLGHAQSFIKKITLTQLADETMKANLIKRMDAERLDDLRSTTVPGLQKAIPPTTPLVMPLNGTAEVLGHISWKPMRAFYLSTGLFITSAVYTILSVTHTLSADGFKTNIEFRYN